MTQPVISKVVPFPINNKAPYSDLGFDPSQPATISAASGMAVNEPISLDKLQIADNNSSSQKKKGPVQKTKDVVRAFKKFGINIAEYTKGTAKGLFDGALVGATLFGVTSLVNKFKTHSKNVVVKDSKYFKEFDASVIDIPKFLEFYENLKTTGKEIWPALENTNKVVQKVIQKATKPFVLSDLNVVANTKLNAAFKKGLEIEKGILPHTMVKSYSRIKLFPAKALAIVGAIGTLLVTYWKTSLNANQKKADVDHRYTPTPVLDKR